MIHTVALTDASHFKDIQTISSYVETYMFIIYSKIHIEKMLVEP